MDQVILVTLQKSQQKQFLSYCEIPEKHFFVIRARYYLCVTELETRYAVSMTTQSDKTTPTLQIPYFYSLIIRSTHQSPLIRLYTPEKICKRTEL